MGNRSRQGSYPWLSPVISTCAASDWLLEFRWTAARRVPPQAAPDEDGGDRFCPTHCGASLGLPPSGREGLKAERRSITPDLHGSYFRWRLEAFVQACASSGHRVE